MQRILRQKVVQATYAYLIHRELAAQILSESLLDTPAEDKSETLSALKHRLEHSVCPPVLDEQVVPEVSELINNYVIATQKAQQQAYQYVQKSLNGLIRDYYLVWMLLIRLHKESQDGREDHVLRGNRVLSELSASLDTLIDQQDLVELEPNTCIEILRTSHFGSVSRDDAALLVYCMRKGLLKNPIWEQWIEAIDPQWEEHRSEVSKWMVQSIKSHDAHPSVQELPTSKTLVDRARQGHAFVQRLQEQTFAHANTHQQQLSEQATHWEWKRMALCDKAILLVAFAEYSLSSAPPLAVLIDEYVEIAKRYSSPQSSAFIHALLDNSKQNTQPTRA